MRLQSPIKRKRSLSITRISASKYMTIMFGIIHTHQVKICLMGYFKIQLQEKLIQGYNVLN